MTRLPHFRRADEPPPMVFTPRDKEILETIHEYEGVLADYQIERLFFNSARRTKSRMSLLYHNGYVDRFTRQQRNSYGFMAYFLGELGIEYLCAVRGILPKELRPRGIEERTSLIRHDVILNDVRITAMEELANLPEVELVEWINSRDFWSDCDTIEYEDTNHKKQKRSIRPDGYIHVYVKDQPKPHKRFLLEVDLRTEDNPRFLREKVIPGITYISSDAYEKRFGRKAGQWLVVTTGETRLENMKRHAEQIGTPARAFYFTTLKEATEPGAFFVKPIWRRATFEEPVALLNE